MKKPILTGALLLAASGVHAQGTNPNSQLFRVTPPPLASTCSPMWPRTQIAPSGTTTAPPVT
jgi:hypothetical protein